MKDLLARLEAAAEGSLELDAEINLAVFSHLVLFDPLAFSTSLDAAMAMPGPDVEALTYLRQPDMGGKQYACKLFDGTAVRHRTWPLAIVTAKLKARSAP